MNGLMVNNRMFDSNSYKSTWYMDAFQRSCLISLFFSFPLTNVLLILLISADQNSKVCPTNVAPKEEVWNKKTLVNHFPLFYFSFILTHVPICPLQSSKSWTLNHLLFLRVVVYFLLLNSRVLGSSRWSDSDVEHVHHHTPAGSPSSHAGARLKMPWSVTKGVHRHVLGSSGADIVQSDKVT